MEAPRAWGEWVSRGGFVGEQVYGTLQQRRQKGAGLSPALGNPPGFQQGVRIWDPGRAWAKVGVGLSHSRKAINRFSILFMD